MNVPVEGILVPEPEAEVEVEGEQVVVPMSTDTNSTGDAKATLREQLKRSLSLSHRPEGSGTSPFSNLQYRFSWPAQNLHNVLLKARERARPLRSTFRLSVRPSRTIARTRN